MPQIVGAFMTPFRRASGRAHSDLAAEAVQGALADAGLDGKDVEAAWIGTAALSKFSGGSLPGALWFGGPGGLLAHGIPMLTVEAACATGGAAFHAAFQAVSAGMVDVALVLGIDLTGVPDPVGLLDGAVVPGGSEFVAAEAQRAGISYEPRQGIPLLLEMTAVEARHAIAAGRVSAEHLAAVTAKNRAHGAQNDHAWLRKAVSAEAVLAEPSVVAPFHRSMGCALVDGAGALVVVSDRFAKGRPRAVNIAGVVAGGGRWRGLGDEPSTATLARRAFAAAGLAPGSVQVAEVHDANAFAELKLVEALGLAPIGEAGPRTSAGDHTFGGPLVVNPSGGLLSRGHALGGTGVAQLVELVAQLRGEAGPRQVEGARVALAHNGGGLVGFDDGYAVVSLITK